MRGPFYNEDDLVDYDVLRYDLDADFTPDRLWVDGNARLKLKIRAYSLTAITLRLADSLVVRSVVSPEFGRLLHLRVAGQNGVIVNFPTPLARDTELWLNVVYGGRLEPQQIDREGIAVAAAQQPMVQEYFIPVEPHYIYSNRSYWYPQSTVTDYATATLRVSVPPDLDVVATGTRTGPPAPAPGPVPSGERPRKQVVFLADEPVRYLACVISRFNPISTTQVLIPARPSAITAAPAGEEGAAGGAAASRWRPGRGHGGHARCALEPAAGRAGPRARGAGGVDHRSSTGPSSATRRIRASPWRSPRAICPAATARRISRCSISRCRCRRWCGATIRSPSRAIRRIFLAHEIAHQWWGQAIGWKNYHEQWLSEGFSQYFAALYAADERGGDTFVVDAPADGAVGDRASRTRGRCTSATGSGTSRETAGCSAPWSTTRARWCCTCCGGWSATSGSSPGCASSTASGSSRRRAPTTSAG